MKARYVIEARQWEHTDGLLADAAKMEPSTTQANVLLAAGLAAAKTGDGATAKNVAAQLRQLEAHFKAAGPASSADVATVAPRSGTAAAYQRGTT